MGSRRKNGRYCAVQALRLLWSRFWTQEAVQAVHRALLPNRSELRIKGRGFNLLAFAV